MKILHTSDWHLGQSFMGQSRAEEHKKFLTWLLEVIKDKAINLLIVAGDIFDTATPPNYALELYYNFLTQLSSSSCENIIITAGNHDSISTLKAPKQLLKALNIHVIASGDKDEDEIIEVFSQGKRSGIVCAVPYLRDYVVRKSKSAQTINEKEELLSLGIKEHYKTLYQEASKLLHSDDIPIIATGHLTTVGSTVSESEREIYIGSTLNIDSSFLGKYFDYVALGHLHRNQKVGCEYIRYSGSPIPLSFSEASSKKRVNIITFNKKEMQVEELDIPIYRKLLVIRGDVDTILEELNHIEDKESWIEINLNDENPMHANQIIRDKASELHLTILALKIDKVENKASTKISEIINLKDIEPLYLFEQSLEKDGLKDDDFKEKLIVKFKNITQEVIDL